MFYIRPVMLVRYSLTANRHTSPLPLFVRCRNSFQCNFPKPRSLFNFQGARARKNIQNDFLRRFSQKSESRNAESKNYSKAEFKRLLGLAKPEKWKLTGAVIFLLLSSGVTMAVPFSLGKVMDIIYTTDPLKVKENLTKLAAILVAVFLVGGLSNFGRVYFMSMAGQNIRKRLNQQVFNAILNQELAFFDQKNTGELVNRLSADTSVVSQALTQNLSDGLRSGVMVLAGVSIMVCSRFVFMPAENGLSRSYFKLALVCLSIVPPIAFMAIAYGRFIKKITKQVQDSLASATSVADEKISNMRTVKAFANEKREAELYQKKMDDFIKFAHKDAFARGVFFGLTGLSGNFIILTVLYYGGVLVSENSMTIGNLTSFLLYAAYVGISINGLSTFYSELSRSLGASIRLWEIVDRVPAISLTGGLKPEKEPKGCIEFGNVTFSYPTRKGYPVLRNLSLVIPEAAITAIVGSSGSGKSTIASILLRLYDPDEGKILLDGVDLEELSPEWVKKQIGFVSQEPVLFSGSIRENILYGAEYPSTVTEEQIIEAAQEANCFDFITKTFAEGFETKVGERGVMLSGGQKQRIAIARALIKNPKILLLDEATSALDAESEHLVQEALEKIMKGRTVLIIAHRLSSIKNSDQIVVLEKGQVVEKGTYQDLMQMEEGAFKKLVKHQAFG